MNDVLRLALGAGALLVTVAPSVAVGPTPRHGASADQAPFWTDWSGPYFGLQGSAGGVFGKGSFDDVVIGSRVPEPISTGAGVDPLSTPIIFGAHAGYNWQTGSFVFGVETDGGVFRSRRTIPTGEQAESATADPSDERSPESEAAPVFNRLRIRNDWLGSVRVRGGLAFGPYLLYATAGLATANARLFAAYPTRAGEMAVGRASETLTGYTTGVGIAMAISPQASLGIEYRFSHFGARSFDLGAGADTPAQARLTYSSHQAMARLTWHPGGLKLAPEDVNVGAVVRKDWSIHAQTTFFQQGVSQFRSPYIGPNSLLPRQARETWTMTAFLGRQLWEGAEIYFNPEWSQGFGLSHTSGLGGYVNGEVQNGSAGPSYRSQRYFFRQAIGLGGEQEQVRDGPNQMAGSRDIDRITVTVGKFAVGDFFDDNAYAQDPRTNFNNWALWAVGAYDYPANLAGYTHGAVVELNRKDWALRAGVFQVPKEPTSDVLDPRVLRKRGAVVELETRHTLFGQPGKLRFGAFLNRGRTGSYREATARTLAEPDSDATEQMEAIRRDRNKLGFYINGEQALTDTVGLFGRVSWNDGRNEILSFTDIDASVSGGLSIKGTSWGRPDDVWGIGAAVNGLSRPHRNYLALGGTGLLIGDGRLNYASERSAETYYAMRLTKRVTASLDYQFIANPAYNADRGPASFLGLRLHAEY